MRTSKAMQALDIRGKRGYGHFTQCKGSLFCSHTETFQNIIGFHRFAIGLCEQKYPKNILSARHLDNPPWSFEKNKPPLMAIKNNIWPGEWGVRRLPQRVLAAPVSGKGGRLHIAARHPNQISTCGDRDGRTRHCATLETPPAAR